MTEWQAAWPVTHQLVVIAIAVLAAMVLPRARPELDAARPESSARGYRAYLTGTLRIVALVATAITAALAVTALTAVPDRKRLLAAKSALVAGVGAAALALSIGASRLNMGDRPPPIAPWGTVGDVLPSAGAAVLSILVTGLVGLGLGLALRSTAVAIVVVGVLLWGLPATTPMLPEPWNVDASAVMVPYLVHEVAGIVEDAPPNPSAAVAVLLVHAPVTPGTGTVTLLRRDA